MQGSECETSRQETKEFKQECWKRLVEERMPAWRGNKDNAIGGKQEDSSQREMLALSATMRISVEEQRNRPLLPQDRRLATGQVL